MCRLWPSFSVGSLSAVWCSSSRLVGKTQKQSPSFRTPTLPRSIKGRKRPSAKLPPADLFPCSLSGGDPTFGLAQFTTRVDPRRLETRSFAGQLSWVGKLPLNPLAWPEPDRRWLYLALLVLTHRRLTEGRVAVARHVLLVDMEIYDGPHQGAGSWLFPNEERLLDRLGEQLHNIGAASLGEDCWVQIVETATALRSHLEANGVGRPLDNVC